MIEDAPSTPVALAIDVGGTNARFGLIDSSGKLHGDITRQPVPFLPNGSADAAALLDLIAPHIAEAQEHAGGPVPLGVSLCGNIDTETGEAVLVANLHWYNVPFGQMLRERFGLPFFAATDVRQAALAEAVWGVARGVRNFAWATVGTGYGGYLFLDGKLYNGTHGFAGNFGHVAWDEINGYPCGCGQWGCFETFVAGPAIARAGQLAVDKKRSPMLAELAAGKPVTAHMVFEAVDAGDPAAGRIIDEVIRLICINLSGVVNLLDVSMIVMGGGVVQAAPWFVERVSTRIRSYLMTAEAKRDLHIVRESFPNSALWGAAASVFAAQGILDPAALG
jgi:glucokinase